jgi:hypothetical protein
VSTFPPLSLPCVWSGGPTIGASVQCSGFMLRAAANLEFRSELPTASSQCHPVVSLASVQLLPNMRGESELDWGVSFGVDGLIGPPNSRRA